MQLDSFVNILHIIIITYFNIVKDWFTRSILHVNLIKTLSISKDLFVTITIKIACI